MLSGKLEVYQTEHVSIKSWKDLLGTGTHSVSEFQVCKVVILFLLHFPDKSLIWE